MIDLLDEYGLGNFPNPNPELANFRCEPDGRRLGKLLRGPGESAKQAARAKICRFHGFEFIYLMASKDFRDDINNQGRPALRYP